MSGIERLRSSVQQKEIITAITSNKHILPEDFLKDLSNTFSGICEVNCNRAAELNQYNYIDDKYVLTEPSNQQKEALELLKKEKTEFAKYMNSVSAELMPLKTELTMDEFNDVLSSGYFIGEQDSGLSVACENPLDLSNRPAVEFEHTNNLLDVFLDPTLTKEASTLHEKIEAYSIRKSILKFDDKASLEKSLTKADGFLPCSAENFIHKNTYGELEIELEIEAEVLRNPDYLNELEVDFKMYRHDSPTNIDNKLSGLNPKSPTTKEFINESHLETSINNKFSGLKVNSTTKSQAKRVSQKI